MQKPVALSSPRTILNVVLALAITAGALVMPLSAGEKKTLTPEQVAALVPQLFRLHLSQKEMNAAFMKNILKEYITQLDPSKMFFTKDEADALINLPDAELKKLAERSLAGDFTYYATILKGFLEKQIARDAALFDNLESREAEIKALLKDKTIDKVADASKEPVPGKEPVKEGAPGKEVASAPKADEDEVDQVKWSERPATHADRETRLLRSVAGLYRIDKTYLSDVDAMKLALQTIREERKRWSNTKVEEETPKLFLKSFMSAMDPHTVYFDAEEDEEFVSRLEPSFAGIGVQIRACPLGAQIEEVIKGGPSERSGKFQKGDQIIRVDDFVLAGLPINKIVRRIKGEKGTEVKLTVLKRETKTTEIIPIKRDTINLAEMRVKGKMFETSNGPIGLVSVQTFYRGVSDDVKKRIQELNKEKTLKGLVLDLRDNHGGYLEEAVNLAGLFIASGPVVGERDGRNIITWKDDTNADVVFAEPLVVLTNQFSASASEIVAGTLRDYGRAVVVGAAQTFGKGTVQRVIPLSNLNLPGEIKITTHQYFLANGDSVQLKGVEPDVVIPGPKLLKEMLESSNENAIPFNRIKGKLDKTAADVQVWSDFRNKNIAMLQENSKKRTENNQEYKDFFDVKKRKAKLAEAEAKKANLKPDEAPPEEKKEDKDFHAEEAVAVVNDMIPLWPKSSAQAATK
ncbi:MAG TPA: S41 family peptidase [Planctomycetota bacterium]|nr:S41 family peptidase [Planctomycetota bacterium]